MIKKNMLLKLISLTIVFVIIFLIANPIIINSSSLTDSAKKVVLKTIEDIEKFVDDTKYPGYKEKLIALKKANPNWSFTLYSTGINWDVAVYNEAKGLHGRSLVQSKTGEWLCESCKTKVYDLGGWMCASQKAVAYFMDSRNFLNTSYIFQFEELSYNKENYTINGIEKILYGTFMYNKTIKDYYNNSNFEDITFSKAIMDAANASGVSPYHLAARIRQELGVNGSNSIYGTYTGYEGFYNFYNICANSGIDPIGNGLRFASNATIGKYLLPWNEPAKAIKGGAIWIATNYIGVGQDTLYFEKFDVVNNGTSLYTHQYMQNIFAPRNEGYTTYCAYSKLGLLDNNYNFIIPVYENMPVTLSQMPSDNKLNTITGLNQKVQLTANNVNVRSSPSTSSKRITNLSKYTIVTRIEKSSSYCNGYYWDKVRLADGRVGYIASNYLSTTILTMPTKITFSTTKKTLGVKETYAIAYKLSPSGAYNKYISFKSSNTRVATVSKSGKITAKKTGTSTITVKTANGKTAKIKITVKKAPKRITLSARYKTIKRGKTYKIRAYLTKQSAGKVTYKSSNTKVATVSSSGKIVTKKRGTATITARTYNGKTAKVKVRVK